MPTYRHRCPVPECEFTIDLDLPIMCTTEDADPKWLEPCVCPRHGASAGRWPRVIGGFYIMGSSGGKVRTERELLKEKENYLEKRSFLHFKNEILPTLDKGTQQAFKKKRNNYDFVSGDHEKMK